MKKSLFVVLLLSNFFAYAQYTLIPDANFEKALISKGIDSGTPDGKVLTASVSGLINLDISNNQITNLTGIKDFTNLEILKCEFNQLSNVDVSLNTALKELNFNNNILLHLDVSKNNKLINLFCYQNQLINLDISNNLSLNYLQCSLNKITNLDVTKNINLNRLECGQNQLSSLNLSNNINLSQLICYENNLTSLDLTNNILLTDIWCHTNRLNSLDLSKNTQLIDLRCGNNNLISLDLSENTNITILHCEKNKLINLNVADCIKLNILVCYINKLANLDVSNNVNLTVIRCYINELLNLNIKNGNNTKLIGIDFASNPNLKCIQVDNVAYFNTNWYPYKDASASFSENCSKIASNTAPIITATGNQIYCPQTHQKIVTGVSIVDPDDTSTNEIYIQISTGYINGQDALTLANPLSHPTIATSWDINAGKLKLYSPTGVPISYIDLIAAIHDVEFNNSSASPSGTRNFSITLGTGQLSYLPSNGHYYEYVASSGINWTKARDEAAAKSYYGLQGYLATLTAADEAQLAGAQAPGTGWIGGSDAATEGTWKWVTGPEAGTTFWIGKTNGTTTAPIYYANWNAPNEPNNSTNSTKPNGEDYAHITAPAVGNPGTWNDLPEAGDPITVYNYYPKGYIVEYGGMPGDPTLEIAASTTITIPRMTGTTASSRCGAGMLTLKASAIDGTINWYDSPNGTTPIATGNSFTTPILSNTTPYYADAGCVSERKLITATIHPLPVVNDISIFQCDSDLIPDGKTLFNLTVKNNAISANYTNETFSYYTTLNGANNALPADLIANELAFENTTPTSMNIWTRVTNTITGCYSVAKITLSVSSTNIPPTYKIIIPPVCDDFLDSNGNNTANNNNRDGIAVFDLTASKATIQALLPPTATYNINYYRNEADALAEVNVITNISNYRNIGYPNTQDIWARIDSNTDNACYGLGPFLTLKVEALPVANSASIPRQCDDNQDGIFRFNTASLEATLLNGQTNVTVTYFDQNNNPLKDSNGILITSPFPASFTTASQNIKAVVTNNSSLQCFDDTTIPFIVDDLPEAFAVPTTLTTVCDDEPNPLNQDGKFAFDTSSFQATILGGQTGMTVKYFDQNGTPLSSPLPDPFLSETQNITVRIENPANTSCFASTTISFLVHPIPKIDLNLDGQANELVCSNLPSFFVTLDAGITDNSPSDNYNYIWKKDGIDTGSDSPTLGVNAVGVYTVEVSNPFGCSRTRTLTVTASNIATIQSIDVVDLADVNSVTVDVTGPGDYEYSLDDSNNFWQDSNLFDNVPSGIHEVFINDKNGCGFISQEIVVVGIPKYFTPNNDSYNDVWGIKGIVKYPFAEVQLFDRYGKYLKTLNALYPNWDGTLNGKLLPASDYWYVIKLDKNHPDIRGHFSLKR